MKNGVEEGLYGAHKDTRVTRILYLFSRGHGLDD
jgi:hypothetical protein